MGDLMAINYVELQLCNRLFIVVCSSIETLLWYFSMGIRNPVLILNSANKQNHQENGNRSGKVAVSRSGQSSGKSGRCAEVGIEFLIGNDTINSLVVTRAKSADRVSVQWRILK